MVSQHPSLLSLCRGPHAWFHNECCIGDRSMAGLSSHKSFSCTQPLMLRLNKLQLLFFKFCINQFRLKTHHTSFKNFLHEQGFTSKAL